MNTEAGEEETNNAGNCALILGGSSGLGLATARLLGLRGYRICCVHRDRRKVLPAVLASFEELRAAGVSLFHFNRDAIGADTRAGLISDISAQLLPGEKIKVLVYSIAKGNIKPMLSRTGPVLEPQDLKLTLDAMALSLYAWTKALMAAGLFAEDSRIIAYTSEGSSRVLPFYGAVAVAKAALEALVRQMAVELAPSGIRINCVQAGVTDTESLRLLPNNEELRARSAERNPFGRLTRAEDVAEVTYLLCRKEAAWITGSIIKADGGESLR